MNQQSGGGDGGGYMGYPSYAAWLAAQNRGTDAFGSVAVVEDSPSLPPPPARAPETVTPAPVITDKGVTLSQPSPAPQPEIAASPAPRQNPSLPASSNNALVDVRVGVQPDKTRIVFDMTSKLNVENTLDNEISVLSFYIQFFQLISFCLNFQF